MSLSKTERLLLSNQYKLLALLDKESTDHYKKLQAIVENGYSIFYSQLDEHISDEMPEENSRLVLDILDLYRAIGDFIIAHPEDQTIKSHAWSTFKGFGGNQECEHLGFTNFLIRIEGKYQEQDHKQGFNSHMPCSDKYRRMIEKWAESDHSFTLSQAQILDILNA
jgi:hypothetical protein